MVKLFTNNKKINHFRPHIKYINSDETKNKINDSL